MCVASAICTWFFEYGQALLHVIGLTRLCNAKALLESICVVSGLTFEESMNPLALARYLEVLEKKRADMLNLRKNHYVSIQVKAELDCKMTAVLDQRDELLQENDYLHLRYELLSAPV